MVSARNSNLLGKVTVLFAICCCCLPAQGKYGGGTGEPNNPYLIYTASHMQAIGADANDWDKHFKLMADIDLGKYTGTSFNIIGERYYDSGWVENPFSGIFDGNGRKISNFTYTSTKGENIGLFVCVDMSGEIKDLGLIDPDVDAGTGRIVGSLVGYVKDGTITTCYAEGGRISGQRDVGGLVGENVGGRIFNCYSKNIVSVNQYNAGGLTGTNRNEGTITNCYATGSVSGDESVGGLVGRASSTVTNCYSTGSVSAELFAGGLVGYNSFAKISDCCSTGSVTGNGSVGGLVGRNSSGTITNCCSTGNVTGDGYVGGLVGNNHGQRSKIIGSCATGTVFGSVRVGGLVGYNFKSSISTCYSTGSVSGYEEIGGIAGKSYLGTITNCYSYSTVSGTNYVGGLVGWNLDRAVTNCYSTGSVSGDYHVGGLVGYNEGPAAYNSFWDIETSGQSTSDGGTGMTTKQMQLAITFFSWGCDPIWIIDDGNDYPRLAWENMPGEPISTPSYGGGNGDPNDPYLIYTAEQLNLIGLVRCHLDKHFKLMADIDLSVFKGTEFNIIGNRWDNTFTGVFDGNSHTISNFTYTSLETDHAGIFGYVNRGEIRNLGLINTEVDAGTGRAIGSLAGYLTEGIISNCYAEGGSVVGDDTVGGLVGFNHKNGTITNCYAAVSVTGSEKVGGLVGSSSSSVINCRSSSNVEGYEYVGGLVGDHDSGGITNCYSTGSISGDTAVGGLTGGTVHGTITNCYSTAIVVGDRYVGGLVGNYYEGTFTNCYSAGSTSGNEYVGGLVGWNNRGRINYCYWDIEASGQIISAGGNGRLTEQMKDPNKFIAWGVCGNEGIWTIERGQDYPRLAWQNLPGIPIAINDIGTLYGGGSGELDDPYLIYTADQFNIIGLVRCGWDRHFKLMADIDLGQFDGKEGREKYNIIGTDFYNVDEQFGGVFYGNGFTIANFTYDSNDKNLVGLFGYVSGEIKDLGLIEPNVNSGTESYVGSLVVWLSYGSVTNCYVSGGNISGGYTVGGMVAKNREGTITNCCSTCSVVGTGCAGGLVGENWGTITNSYSTSSVLGDDYVGGLVGRNGAYPCDSQGCRHIEGTITNCYATGSIEGYEGIGGLVGFNYGSEITNCYSTGKVLGISRFGGLVGYSMGGEVYNSFWDIETSGQTSSAGGTGLPTDQMQMVGTFTDAGWDFVGETVNGIEDIWFIPYRDYPHFWWEGMKVPMKLTPVSLNCRSEGNWVKAHITLPQGFTVEDVDPHRLAVLLHSYGFVSAPLYVFVNKNELVEIEAVFERQAVCSLADDWPDELTVAGFLTDGNIFLGTSNIRIIHPGMKVIEDLAWYWLNADCVHPDFCDGIDMNRDSLVNLLDYALLMNINVEFVTDE